ncbi:MAG TPA: M15 family metallopeptidase [Polyangiales bacterium]|nr:M15 family metallopeptidase [Polyangiales bacterium]
MPDINASVGKDAINKSDDVFIVQRLLNERGFRCGTPDGVCGSRTRDAIIAFQRGFMHKPDGRVDPGGSSMKRLNQPGKPVTTESGSLTRLVPKPERSTINSGLVAVNNTLMTQFFGKPREDYSEECQPVTNAVLKRNMTSASIGPFKVTGMTQAVRSLGEIMPEIQRLQPDVYAALGTAGMLCCRWVRGSTTSISNHSWGTAIDLKLNGVLDARGNNQVQYGLTLIAPIFNRFGWYWGAGFTTEDAMHFEAGRALVESWRPT